MKLRAFHWFLCAMLAALSAWAGREAAQRAAEDKQVDERTRSWAAWNEMPEPARAALLEEFQSFQANPESRMWLETARRLRMLPPADEQALVNLRDAVRAFTSSLSQGAQRALQQQPPPARAAMFMRMVREAAPDTAAEWQARFGAARR